MLQAIREIKSTRKLKKHPNNFLHTLHVEHQYLFYASLPRQPV